MDELDTPLDSLFDPPVQARIAVLAERANDGVLTSEERDEYEALINNAEFISILRLNASRRPKPDPA